MTATKKRNRKKKPPKICPNHGVKLVYAPNRWGSHWKCPEAGCTVRCWGGDTSSPGDAETFEERKLTHAAFDPLWQAKLVFRRRADAYVWMQGKMNLGPRDGHIGMMSAEQCRQLRSHIEALLSRPQPPTAEAK